MQERPTEKSSDQKDNNEIILLKNELAKLTAQVGELKSLLPSLNSELQILKSRILVLTQTLEEVNKKTLQKFEQEELANKEENLANANLSQKISLFCPGLFFARENKPHNPEDPEEKMAQKLRKNCAATACPIL